MNWTIKTVLLVLVACGISACAGPGTNLVGSQQLSITTLPGVAADVRDIAVRQEGSQVTVRGSVVKLHDFKLPGHVDVVVFGPGGEVVEQARGTITGHASKRGGLRAAKFHAPLQAAPPAGGEIRVRYHAVGARDCRNG